MVIGLMTPGAYGAEIRSRQSLEAIVTAATDSSLAMLNVVAENLIAEAIEQNLGSSEALTELVTPLIRDYLAGIAAQHIPAAIRGRVSIDGWIDAVVDSDLVMRVAGEIVTTDLYASILDYAALEIMEAINLDAIRGDIIRSRTDAIWNGGRPSRVHFRAGSWRRSAINFNVAVYTASAGINQVEANFRSIDLGTVVRGSVQRALGQALIGAGSEIERLIRDNLPQLPFAVR